ncbi:efflux RND transporter periplasmic adaptor subunit [Nonomuraea sediminis]|uniref:efflux RND transporter periplasmic adaptor subunit n=1 Tax=Nonomuraea sediminis TaxID=2835864 RepID=UPI001BDC8A43|nr:peptidoglycan-binding protein [Nonomuraea sediminis]
MRKVIAGAGLLGVAAAALVVWNLRGTAAAPTAGTAARTASATATVTRQDLVDTKTVDGSLTYSGSRRVTTDAAGTVTWVPDEGAVIRRGRPLLRVDRKPVTLMYGKLPLYRALATGVSDGPDVEQLERNLAALGYSVTVDQHFSYATYLAVKSWQEDHDLPETGRVDSGQVVFLPGAVRVTSARAEAGERARPGQEVLLVSDTERIVHVDLDTGDQELARKGARCTVTLPGGERVAGRITTVGTVAKEVRGQDRTTMDLEITLRKIPRTRLDQAPVDVELSGPPRRNVLAVPLEALLATRTGFGVEVVSGGSSAIVPVRVGVFGGGMVEVSGGGLAPGMKVGVPAS